jgi:hypothetical protein
MESTAHYAAQRGVYKKIFGLNFTLSCIAPSRRFFLLCAMHRVFLHSTESQYQCFDFVTFVKYGSKVKLKIGDYLTKKFSLTNTSENTNLFATALAHESVDPKVLFDEKTRGRKSRETVPLSTL